MADFDRNEVHIGYGKHLYWADLTEEGEIPALDAAETWHKVAGTKSVTLPERELGTSEITNDDSPDFHKDYIPSLYEPGTAPFNYVYTGTQYAELEELFMLASDTATRGEATKGWKCVIAEDTTNEAVAWWKGFLTKHPLPIEGEDSPEVECEIQVSGKMRYANESEDVAS